MTLAYKISALLLALENGFELKLPGGQKIVWEPDLGPGVLMTRYVDNKPGDQFVMQIGEDVIYGLIVAEAKRLSDVSIAHIQEIYP